MGTNLKSKPIPAIGRIVLVKIDPPIGDQSEHAAVITKVSDADTINVMVFPGTGMPFPLGSILHEENAAISVHKAAVDRLLEIAPNQSVSRLTTWRWPPRA